MNYSWNFHNHWHLRPIYRRGHWSTAKLYHSPQVTQPERGKAGIQTPAPFSRAPAMLCLLLPGQVPLLLPTNAFRKPGLPVILGSYFCCLLDRLSGHFSLWAKPVCSYFGLCSTSRAIQQVVWFSFCLLTAPGYLKISVELINCTCTLPLWWVEAISPKRTTVVLQSNNPPLRQA